MMNSRRLLRSLESQCTLTSTNKRRALLRDQAAKCSNLPKGLLVATTAIQMDQMNRMFLEIYNICTRSQKDYRMNCILRSAK